MATNNDFQIEQDDASFTYRGKGAEGHVWFTGLGHHYFKARGDAGPVEVRLDPPGTEQSSGTFISATNSDVSFYGGRLSDIFQGGGGDDYFHCSGFDQVTGGSGADTFFMNVRIDEDRHPGFPPVAQRSVIMDYDFAEGDTITIASDERLRARDLSIYTNRQGDTVIVIDETTRSGSRTTWARSTSTSHGEDGWPNDGHALRTLLEHHRHSR